MASLWNDRISISIFGESHGTGIGVVMDNLPPGEYIRMEDVLAFMSRRAPIFINQIINCRYGGATFVLPRLVA